MNLYAVYAKRQGDKRKSDRIYAKFSNLANNIAGIPRVCRNLATATQLKICAMIETIIAETLKQGIAANLYYKDIENKVLNNGAELLQLTANQVQQLR